MIQGEPGDCPCKYGEQYRIRAWHRFSVPGTAFPLFILLKVIYNKFIIYFIKKELMMVKRHVDSLGVDVSLLGFGCMRLPLVDKEASQIDYPAAQKMVDRAFKAGVNYFDTAWPYHEKMSEVFVGETLSKYPRDSYYLASKMPTWEVF
jgi:hypothetical protein